MPGHYLSPLFEPAAIAVLAENQHMLAWAKRHGFELERGGEPDLIHVSKRL